MFGPRITTVFRSRWRAVWWAASVLLGVYCMVPRQGDQDDASAQQAIAALVQQGQPGGQVQPQAQPEHHVNPWAKSAPR